MIPIEIQESMLSAIAKENASIGMEVNHFELEQEFEFTIDVYFIALSFEYNML